MHLHFPWYFPAIVWFTLGAFLTYQFFKITENLPEDDEDEEEDYEKRRDHAIKNTPAKTALPRSFDSPKGVEVSREDVEKWLKNNPEITIKDA